MNQAKENAIVRACETLMKNPRFKIHNAYVGFKNGDTAGKICAVVETDKKLSASGLSSQGLIPVPSSVFIVEDGITYEVVTDVAECPKAKPAVKMLSDDDFFYPQGTIAQSIVDDARKCHSPLIYGGAQIAPRGAGWVGTNGAGLTKAGHYGSLTNWHVAHGGQFSIGSDQCQPSGQGPVFGKLMNVVPLKFSAGQKNRVDAAFIVSQDVERKRYNCVPEQLGFGRIDPRPYGLSDIKLGMRVQKSGRTTGHTTGEVIGLRSMPTVDYGESGDAEFVDQIVIRSRSGNFSAGGDSGSLICDRGGRPVALLFAGGGQDTIATPISFVVEELGVQFF